MEIAVLGAACRFPGAPDADTFWSNLRDGVESIERLPERDLLAAGLDPETIAHPDYVPAAALLDGHDLFDARFFGFGAREATLLDPQHRVFLECAWHAMEDAGVRPGSVGHGGVMAAANMPAYLMSNLMGGRPAILDSELFELQIHNDKDYLATRVAHRLGFTGPAVSVQTACSSSLVAIHQAARSLRDGECDLALAGGVCVRVPHRVGYRYERGMVFSRDGHCRPFDAGASGTVFGNGVGAVVLKRMADALADGDRVIAVLKGSAVNNDGSGKVGYTAPSVEGQEAVVRAAMRSAGVDPATVTAIEAHGTATQIGDPIEITALTRAFDVRRRGFCTVGAVKSNIGHLESAAGVAGFVKALLQLRHRTLAPTLHYTGPNPGIDFDGGPFRVRREAADWDSPDAPRRIGVSAFGIGGTNAHVVLEEAPARPRARPVDRPQVLVLSARTAEALASTGDALAAALGRPGAPAVEDAAATLRRGREVWRYRRAVVVRGPADADGLAALRSPAAPPAVRDPRVVWMFPGQGAQFPGMGRGLHRELPEYAGVVDECAAVLEPLLGTDLRDSLLRPDADPARLRSTDLAQPALFVTGYALARQLLAWGCAPDTMVGHSLGELVALCLAGVLSLPDALRVVAERGRLMAGREPGSMLAVHAPESETAGLLPAGAGIGAVNAPRLCVVSGTTEAVARAARLLDGRGIQSTPLHTSHAFHSAMMDGVVGPLEAVLGTVALRPPGRTVHSAVTGSVLTDAEACDPGFWAAHARRPVRFADALAAAVGEDRDAVLVEVGPGATLGTLARSTLSRERTVVLRTMLRPGEDGDEPAVLAGAAGSLWQHGCAVDLEAVHDGAGAVVGLPGYAFARQRYWTGPGAGGRTAGPGPDAPAPAAAERPAELSGSFAGPTTELAVRVVAVWEEVLQYRPVGVHDDFFELGGHSLLAARLSGRLSEALGQPVSLRDVMALPTPAAFADDREKRAAADQENGG